MKTSFNHASCVASYFDAIADGKIFFRNKQVKVLDEIELAKSDGRIVKYVSVPTDEKIMYFKGKGKAHFCLTKRNSELSEFAGVYLMHAACKIAITGTRTLVNHSGNNSAFDMYADVVKAVKALQANFDFDACADSDYNELEKGYSVKKVKTRKVGGKIVSYVPTLVTKLIENGDYYNYDNVYFKEDKNGFKHAYYDVIVEVKHEKNLYVPCYEEYVETKVTKTELSSLEDLISDKGMPLVHDVYESLLTLVRKGLINSYQDIWHNVRYAYRALNKSVRSWKNEESTDAIKEKRQDKDGRLIDYSFTTFDAIHDELIVKSFIKYVWTHAKVTKRETLCKIIACFARGMNQSEIAQEVGISQSTVSRSIATIATYKKDFNKLA